VTQHVRVYLHGKTGSLGRAFHHGLKTPR
jgi:hypothetical protein